MKFWGVFRFELAYQLRRVWPWLIFAIVLVISFLMTRDAAVQDAVYDDFFVNSPFSIAITTVVGGLVWLLMAAVIAGEAAARDVATQMHPLVYTAPISKTEYLGARFLAALALNALILVAVQAGAMLAIYSPGVNAEVIGPFRPAAYLTAYAFIALPNAFVATAIQFLIALRSGRPMAAYVGSWLLMFMGFFVASLLLFNRGLGAIVDPIGIRFVVEEIAHLWTPIEKNSRLLSMEGIVLTNRLIWLGVGVATLALTWVSFQFAHRTERQGLVRRWRRAAAQSPRSARLGVMPTTPISAPRVQQSFGFAIDARKTVAIARASFRSIAASLPGLAVLIGIPLLTVLVVLDQTIVTGIPLIPATALVIRELTTALSDEMSRWVIVPLLIVFFAGELVWREREAGVSEINDAMPGSEWTSLLGKFLGLSLVMILFMAMLTAAGVLAQVISGYHNFEIGLYAKTLLGLQLTDYLLFAVLALMVHALVDQKYVGHLIAVLIYMFILVLAPMFGIEHKLLIYAASPEWSYTEMRGFAGSVGPWLWFKAYWAAWALLLAVIARLLWVRGKDAGLGMRIARARRGIPRTTAAIGGAAAVLVVLLGGFVFYNTNVLNEYHSTKDINELRAEYERRYRRYENLPQPRITATILRVDIHPQRRAAEIRGSYTLENATAVEIDSIHIATAAASGIETRAMTLDRPATLAVNDAARGYRIYALKQPLKPGETLRLDFEVRTNRSGFSHQGVDPSVVPGGTYFKSEDWFPFVGYQRMREILPPAERRKNGLAPRPVLASLYEFEGGEPTTRGGGIAFEATVATDADQIAVAPGALRRTWAANGRRHFHYVTDAPIGTEWAFYSAKYEVQESRWNDVAIRIFHHPQHTAHTARMMASAQASMEYYSKQFGSYPYRHLTIVEHPGAPGTGAHADASMISHGEAWAYWIPKNEKRLDFPYAVMAHEMAHQWALPLALVEGLPFMAEGLAWFYAMQVVEHARGEEQLRGLLSQMRQPFPHKEIRRGEPLLRGMDPYLSYRKGPFAMYALTQYIGLQPVNTAMRRMFEKHDAPGAPLATTLDLYRELKAVTPDSLQPLLRDLFEVNTYWRLKIERATAKQTSVGAWLLTLDVHALKEVFDSAGVQTEVPMNEWLEIGVFGEVAPGERELSNPVYVHKHRIRSGKQTISVTLHHKPVLAGIDPYHVLDWEEHEEDDNIGRVEMIPSEGRGSSP